MLYVIYKIYKIYKIVYFIYVIDIKLYTTEVLIINNMNRLSVMNNINHNLLNYERKMYSFRKYIAPGA